MNKHNSVPNIRFKGFENKWELSKLGSDLISIHTGTNLLGSETPGGTPLIKMGNLKNGFFDFSKLDYLPICENVKNEDKVGFGDFLFNTRNTLDLVGKGATWMYESTKFAYNNNIAKFNFQNSVDTVFFNYLYNTYNVMNQIHARATGTTSVAAIYPKSLDSITYNLPSKQEQQKIGNFFTKLDKLLDLQQQKIDKLELLKKALLQKLFPKHDAKIPDVRFRGFYDKWEKITFSEIGTVTTGNTPSTKQTQYYSKMGTPWITPSNIDKNGKLYNLKYLSKEGAKIGRIVPAGSVLVTSIASIGKNTLLKKDSAFNQQINAITPKKKYDSYFLYSACNQVSKEMKNTASAGTMQIVNKKEFSRMVIKCPLLSEQQKIGNLLSKVDQLIELENQKLQNFQQVKKCLLQNMFVE